MEYKRFRFYMKRGLINNELYYIGIIQGLIYGICSIPCETTMWDCDLYGDIVVFTADCTVEHCEKLMEIVNNICPNLCHYQEEEI